MDDEIIVEYEQLVLGIYLYHGPEFLHFDIRMIMGNFTKTFPNVKIVQSRQLFLAHLFDYNGERMIVRQARLENRDINKFNEAIKILEHKVVKDYFLNHYEKDLPKMLEYRKKVLRLS